MLWLKPPRMAGWYRFAKRGLDICIAIPGLLILVLLLIVVVPWMLWEERGPIFYRQLRIGQLGKPFWLYKVRSMVVNADVYLWRDPALLNTWQQAGKLREDPRVTRVGKFLRRCSLDELPQLINVLRGEMSLVGPRPVQSSEIAAFGELNGLRQTVKPGLTGLWQISGRSTTDYTQRALLDCTYVTECSLAIDLYILCKTFPVLIYGDGAY